MIGRLLAWLYPACAATGTQGLPIPDPVNLAWLAAEPMGNAALAAPADAALPVDLPTQLRDVSAEALYAALLRVGAARPLTWLAASYPTRLQAHFVTRSPRLNLPAVIVAEARPVGPSAAPPGTQGSVVLLYARTVYGRSGAGALRRILQEWLAALDAELARQSEG